MKYLFFLLLIVGMSLLLGGCLTNQESLLPPPELPDEVSFTEDIFPIFNNSCGGSSCHTNGGTQGNVDLNTYRTTMQSIGNSYGTEIVIPGDADNSPIVDKIESNPRFGSRMPLGSGPLPSEEIALIKKWINEGVEDN